MDGEQELIKIATKMPEDELIDTIRETKIDCRYRGIHYDARAVINTIENSGYDVDEIIFEEVDID